MDQEISPDDACGVCGSIRDAHGDRNHVFTLTDELIPLSPRPKARQSPPAERGSNTFRPDPPLTPSTGSDTVSRSFATLLEVLVEKGVLKATDIIRIFQGNG